MKYFLMIFCLVLGFYANASLFEGCGEYQFRGKLIAALEEFHKVKYVVNEGTVSAMTFSIPDNDDSMKISLFFNRPTSFNAKILKPMNGTKGEIKSLTEIALRFPNPLRPEDTGITKLSSLDCL